MGICLLTRLSYSGVPLSLKMYNCSRELGAGVVTKILALREVTFLWWHRIVNKGSTEVQIVINVVP